MFETYNKMFTVLVLLMAFVSAVFLGTAIEGGDIQEIIVNGILPAFWSATAWLIVYYLYDTTVEQRLALKRISKLADRVQKQVAALIAEAEKKNSTKKEEK